MITGMFFSLSVEATFQASSAPLTINLSLYLSAISIAPLISRSVLATIKTGNSPLTTGTNASRTRSTGRAGSFGFGVGLRVFELLAQRVELALTQLRYVNSAFSLGKRGASAPGRARI